MTHTTPSSATRTSRSARAFTLLEVMIVIAIIGLILGIVGFNVVRQRGRATEQLVDVQLKNIQNALKLFYNDFNRYPTDDEGLAVLWTKENIAPEDETKWGGPYMDEGARRDTWGSEWGYRAEGENAPEGMYDLWSNGPDKQEGTDDDVNVWTSVMQDSDAGPGGPDLPPALPPG